MNVLCIQFYYLHLDIFRAYFSILERIKDFVRFKGVIKSTNRELQNTCSRLTNNRGRVDYCKNQKLKLFEMTANVFRRFN